VKRSPVPAGAGRDMLSAGASSGTAAGPRAVVEQAVRASPGDVSDGEKSNLAINNFFPSEVAAAADTRPAACSTSACRGGGHDLASTLTPAAASVAHGAVLEALAP
jgi:hypothetical protein